jgi:hypothetical protein
MSAEDAKTFNVISGKPFQAFNDLRYTDGFLNWADVSERPWAGAFTYRNKKTLSRVEVTLSEVNANADCLRTLFSTGLGLVMNDRP